MTNLVVENCIFKNNTLPNLSGVGGFQYAGIASGISALYLNAKISNTLFYNNTRALALISGPGAIDTDITNCTFHNNGEFPISKNWNPNFNAVDYYNNMTISNSIIWEFTPIEKMFYNNNFVDFNINDYVINHSLVNAPNCEVAGVDACLEGMIFEENPLFIDTLLGDYHLKSCSPAINAGNNDLLNPDILTDLNGEPRILENIVDLGVYERIGFSTEVTEIIDETCEGAFDGEVMIETIGDTPFSFDWQMDSISGEGISNLSAGNYLITVSDSLGCIDTLSAEIAATFELNVFSTVQDASTFMTEDGAIFIDSIIGGIEPYQFLWNTGDTTNSLENIAADIYSVIVTDENGCEKELEFIVDATNSIEDVDKGFQFSLSPNPTPKNTQINLFSNQKITQNLFISIFDTSGKLIKRQERLNFNSNQATLDSPNISGIYFLKIENEKGILNYQKLVVE